MNDVTSVVRQTIVKQLIIRVLRSTAVQRINFFIGFLHITGAGYQRVVSALSDGSITVKLGDLPEGAAAQFDQEDYFRFPDGSYGFDPSDLMAIVHESTHALVFHAKASPLVADTVDEAAAYVAGALYNAYAGSPVSSRRLIDPLFVQASAIASRIQNQPGALVSTEELARLRAFIAIHPTYYNMGVKYFSYAYRS